MSVGGRPHRWTHRRELVSCFSKNCCLLPASTPCSFASRGALFWEITGTYPPSRMKIRRRYRRHRYRSQRRQRVPLGRSAPMPGPVRAVKFGIDLIFVRSDLYPIRHIMALEIACRDDRFACVELSRTRCSGEWKKHIARSRFGKRNAASAVIASFPSASPAMRLVRPKSGQRRRCADGHRLFGRSHLLDAATAHHRDPSARTRPLPGRG